MNLQSLLVALQTRIDNGGFLGTPRNKSCQGVVTIAGGMPAPCPRSAVLPIGGKVECSLHKFHTVQAELKYLCLLHLLQDTSGVDMPTPLLEIMNGSSTLSDPYADSNSQTVMSKLFEAHQAAPYDPDPENDESEQDDICFDTHTDEMAHVAFTINPSKPAYCMCDWLIKSPLARALHDERHSNWQATHISAVAPKESPELASVDADHPPLDDPERKIRKTRTKKSEPAKRAAKEVAPKVEAKTVKAATKAPKIATKTAKAAKKPTNASESLPKAVKSTTSVDEIAARHQARTRRASNTGPNHAA